MKKPLIADGLWQLHLAVLILGGTTMFPKLLPLSPQDLIAGRSLVAAVAIALLLMVTAKPLQLTGGMKSNFHGFWIGLIMGLHWLTFFHGIQLAGPAIAVSAFYCFPLISVLLEALIARKAPSPSQLLSGVFVIVGVGLLMPEFDLNNSASAGALWGVLSGFLYALRNVLQREFLPRQSALTTMMWQLFGVFALCLPLQSLFTISSGFAPHEAGIWLGLALLGVAFTAIPHSLFVKGLMLFPASTAGIIGALQPLYSTLFGALLLQDIPTAATATGCGIIIAVAVYESWSANRRKV